MRNQDRSRNNENRDRSSNINKEDISKKASILEERVFGKDLKNYNKNITFRNKNEKEKGKEKEKTLEKSQSSQNLLNYNILKRKDENSNANSQNLNSSNNNIKKENRAPNKIEIVPEELKVDYVRVGDKFIRTNNNVPRVNKGKSRVNEANKKSNTFNLSLREEEDLNLEPFELEYKNNPQYIVEYSREIFEYLKKTEGINKAEYGYFSFQKDINEKTRAILIDWLVEVHYKFSLLPETLFLAVNLIDRFLSRTNVELKQFQLLGVTSMLIASKYEEIYAPEIRDFVYVTEKVCSRQEILEMESTILAQLEFDILYTSPLKFLERFHFISNDNTERKTFFMAQFVLELSLLEYNMLNYPSSLQAAAALYLARRIFRVDENVAWNNTLHLHTGYREKELTQCFKDMCRLIDLIPKLALKAGIKKFSHSAFGEVATIFTKKLVHSNNNK